jgi:hypothetical protein
VVVPVTLPLAAVIEVDRPPDGGDSPAFKSTVLQLLVLVAVVPSLELVEVPELLPELVVELLELLVCAAATETPRPNAASDNRSVFMACSSRLERGIGCADVRSAQPSLADR